MIFWKSSGTFCFEHTSIYFTLLSSIAYKIKWRHLANKNRSNTSQVRFLEIVAQNNVRMTTPEQKLTENK